MAKDIGELEKEYEEKRPLYEAFTKKVESVVEALLKESKLKFHSISSRTKKVDRFIERLSRKKMKCEAASDMTDLAGVRIICYFSDQVDLIAEIIRSNFEVNDELSVDKREVMDPDRFGYLSLHYIVKFSTERSALPEYRRFESLVCEIQIRSILQHAWAEIEHDLGYKSPIEIPRDIRRRFFMLAGQLEAADQEFVRIKSEIETYSEKVEKEIEVSPQDVLIDKVSITSYLLSSPVVGQIDEEVVKQLGGYLYTGLYSEIPINVASYLGIGRIDELSESLQNNKEDIIKFAGKWGTKYESENLPILIGVSILYLGYVIIGRKGRVEDVSEFLHALNIGEVSEYEETSRALVEIVKEISTKTEVDQKQTHESV